MRRAFGVRSFAERIKALRPDPAGLTVRMVDDDTYESCIVRDDGCSTIHYGIAEAVSDASPRQFVGLVETEPHFGGRRYWFRCPRGSCQRKCSVLYRERHSNARAFVCRRCIRFRYKTQVLGEADLIVTRIEKLLARMDLQPEGTVRRRKGMHQRTFRSLAVRLDYQTAQWKATSPLARHCDRSFAKLERRTSAMGSAGRAETVGKDLNRSGRRTSS